MVILLSSHLGSGWADCWGTTTWNALKSIRWMRCWATRVTTCEPFWRRSDSFVPISGGDYFLASGRINIVPCLPVRPSICLKTDWNRVFQDRLRTNRLALFFRLKSSCQVVLDNWQSYASTQHSAREHLSNLWNNLPRECNFDFLEFCLPQEFVFFKLVILSSLVFFNLLPHSGSGATCCFHLQLVLMNLPIRQRRSPRTKYQHHCPRCFHTAVNSDKLAIPPKTTNMISRHSRLQGVKTFTDIYPPYLLYS